MLGGAEPELAPLLKALVHESAAPLRVVETTFATDSTGFATNTYARWFDEKHGGEKRCQRWIKLHAQVGTVTNVIASVEATESNVGDPVMLAPLLASSVARGFSVRELSADKAYLSNDNLTAIEAAGAMPYIPFKSNSRPTGKSDAWRRMAHVRVPQRRVPRALPPALERRDHVLDGQARVRVLGPRQDVPDAGQRGAPQGASATT